MGMKDGIPRSCRLGYKGLGDVFNAVLTLCAGSSARKVPH